jgi:Rrf2 family protein
MRCGHEPAATVSRASRRRQGREPPRRPAGRLRTRPFHTAALRSVRVRLYLRPFPAYLLRVQPQKRRKGNTVLNQTAEYALRAVLFLAAQEDRTPRAVGVVADALHVPQNYLSKVLHVLAREQILNSMRGPTGGFWLGRPADALTLADVISPFDPVEDRCLLVRRKCSEIDPCTAHHEWKSVSRHIRRFFRDTTVAALLESAAAAGRPGVALLPSLYPRER